jgi:hypothetical protein
MESASQWVSKMGRPFFLLTNFRYTAGTYTSKQLPQQEIAFSRAVLNDLELRIIEFMLEWMVALLMPAKHILEIRSPHLAFMLEKECWFRELYLGLKVAASRSQRVKSENH